MRPDVAIVSLYPPPGRHHAGRSGVASYTANLVRGLRGAGARVTVIAPSERGIPDVVEEDGTRIERRFRRGPSALPVAVTAARATGAPVVHVQHELFLYGGPTSAPGVVPALGSLRAGGPPSVVTLHQVVDPGGVDGDFVRLHRVRAPAALARLGLGAAQRAVRGLADRVIVHEPAFARVVPGAQVIPHGVETLRTPDRHTARRHLGVDGFVVLQFGFLAPYKGLEGALRAAELADGRVRFVVAGGEHPRLAGRDPYADELRSRWGRIARFTGFVPEEDVARWFAAADLALFPYPRPFSASGALALALAHGTPVLLSEALRRTAGASPELETPTDPPSLAERLVGLADQPDTLAGLRRATRRLGDGRDWRTVAGRHLELYEEVGADADRTGRRRVRAG